MGTIATIATVVLGISFMVFVAFFGRLPAFRRTPIAWLHRLLWVHLPNGVLALDQRLTSGRFTASMKRFGHFMVHDKHPTVLIFFFLLLSVSQVLALPSAWPLLSLSRKIILVALITLTYALLYLAAYSDPGFITPANLGEHLTRYPYDYTVFHPGQTCRTCNLLKPARSKHCSICKGCVAKLDHHCIFINNCVGRGNQHWFLLLLLFTGLQTLYGGFLGASLVVAKIHAHNTSWALLPWNANDGGGMLLHDWLVMWSWGLQDRVGLGSVSMLSLMTTPLVWSLLVYNLWLVYGGTTTNESLKWSDMSYDMADGLVFKRRMPSNRPKDLRFEAAWTRWPVEPAQIVVQTDDGKPPTPEQTQWLQGEGEWEPVWSVRDVENLYDVGLRDNLIDAFLPGYVFCEEEAPGDELTDRGRRIGRQQG